MRTSAILAFVFAAIAAPSLAAPALFPSDICDRYPAACIIRPRVPISFTKPVNVDLSSKNNKRHRYEDEGSGAFLVAPLLDPNSILGNHLSHLPGYGPSKGARSLELKRSRDLHELILRAVDDESGAFWKTVWNVFNQVMGSIPLRSSSQSYTPPPPPPPPPTDAQQSTDQQAPTDGQQQTQQRRKYLEHVAREYNDVYELLARAATDDESGAGLFSIIRTVAGPLINMFTGGSNNQRRAMVELLARAAQDDESGADFLGVLGDVGNAFLKIFGRDNNQRREMVELLARAAEDDESGAGLFSFIPTLANTLVNVLTGGGNQQQQRRDLAAVVELLARANYDLE